MTTKPWPVPMWPEFWPWAGWKLAGSPEPRPVNSRKLSRRYHDETGRYGVPPWAWVRLAAMRARPRIPVPQAPNVPFPFNGRGMALLEPTGGTEDVAAWKRAGGTYLLLNLAHIGGGSWDVQRQRAAACGLTVVPWQYVRTQADVAEVELVAESWGSVACAHNLEAEAMGALPPNLLGAATDPFPHRVRAVITEPWMQNGAGWAALGRRGWVAMPEAFMNAKSAYDPTVLCSHAHAEGMPLAVPMFGWGQWSDAGTFVPAADYLARWNGPFAVYPGDGKEQLYQAWNR